MTTMTKTIVLLKSHFNLYFTEGGLILWPLSSTNLSEGITIQNLTKSQKKKGYQAFLFGILFQLISNPF